MTASSDENQASSLKLRKQYEVNEKKVKAALFLIKARLICTSIVKTSKIAELVEILSELGHFDLAI